MIKRKAVRIILGLFLGGAAGLSLTASILPTILTSMGLGDSLFIRWALSDYASHSALVWAVAGWAVTRVSVPPAGALILGIVGAASGLLVCMAAFGTDTAILLSGGIGGAAYGAIGGLLLGNVLCCGGTSAPRTVEN